MKDKEKEKSALDKVKERAKQIDEKIEAVNEAAVEAAKGAVDDKLEGTNAKFDELKASLKEDIEGFNVALDKVKTEQEKMSMPGVGNQDYFAKALQENEEQLKDMQNKSKAKSTSIKLDAGFLAKATMTTVDSLGDPLLIPRQRTSQMPIYDPEARPLRDFFNVSPLSSNQTEWPIESSYDMQAGAVASDGITAKPESTLTWDLETRPVRTIAHTGRLHKDLMADMPMLRNYLSVRFRDGLFREESRQLIKGTNANNELLGLVNTETHVPFDSASFQAALSGTGIAVADANYFDILDYARTQLRLNEYNGNQILVNPVAGFVFNHTVDSQGGYLMNGANWSMISQLMNESTYIDEDVFYVFDGQQSGTIYQRENVTVDFSYEDRDNFIKNLVTIRAEMREVFVIERPNAIIRGTYSAATSTT